MDYRTEIEKKIDTFFEAHEDVLAERWRVSTGEEIKVDSGLTFVQEGSLSPFKAVYELFSGDNAAEVRWCFRSEGKRIAAESISTGNTIDDIIRSIMNGIIGAVNNNMDHQKQINSIIEKSFEEERDGVVGWCQLTSEIRSYINEFARLKINAGETYQDAYVFALDEAWMRGMIDYEICCEKKAAIRNIKQEDFLKYRSYSKYLAAPLFKYYKSSALTFAQMKLNSLKIEFVVHCYDWCGEKGASWDGYDRYYEEVFDCSIDLRCLCSKKILKQKMLELLEEEVGSRFAYMDIDYVDFSVTGFTIDLEHLDKTKVNKYIKANRKDYEKCIASQKSYKKDKEVITTDIGEKYYTVCSEEVIQIIRFIYILFIWGLEEERQKIAIAFFNNELGSFDKTEIDAVEWFLGYMEVNVKEERKEYGSIFDFESKEWELGLISECSSEDKEKILRLLEKFRRRERFPNAALFEKMKQICLEQ